jgi:hypothetical protein
MAQARRGQEYRYEEYDEPTPGEAKRSLARRPLGLPEQALLRMLDWMIDFVRIHGDGDEASADTLIGLTRDPDRLLAVDVYIYTRLRTCWASSLTCPSALRQPVRGVRYGRIARPQITKVGNRSYPASRAL